MLKSYAMQILNWIWMKTSWKKEATQVLFEGVLWLIVPKRLSSVLTLALSCVVSAETFSCDVSSSLRSLRI